MTPELTPLVLAALLQFVQVQAYSRYMTRENGLEYNLSPRDTEPKLSVTAARLRRAANNHSEALLLFAIGVLVVGLSGKSSTVTEIAAWAYLVARILYVPAYAMAWMPWRSVFFLIGTVSTLTLLVAALV